MSIDSQTRASLAIAPSVLLVGIAGGIAFQTSANRGSASRAALAVYRSDPGCQSRSARRVESNRGRVDGSHRGAPHVNRGNVAADCRNAQLYAWHRHQAPRDSFTRAHHSRPGFSLCIHRWPGACASRGWAHSRGPLGGHGACGDVSRCPRGARGRWCSLRSVRKRRYLRLSAPRRSLGDTRCNLAHAGSARCNTHAFIRTDTVAGSCRSSTRSARCPQLCRLIRGSGDGLDDTRAARSAPATFHSSHYGIRALAVCSWAYSSSFRPSSCRSRDDSATDSNCTRKLPLLASS